MIVRRIVIVLSLVTPLLAQSSVPFLSFPSSYASGRVQWSIGASLAIMPRAVVEEEIRQIPMIDANVRYGLFDAVSLTGSFSTIYLTNVATAGLHWTFSLGDVHASIGDNVSYWFGTATMQGFDTQVMGLVTVPGVSAGMDFDGSLVTLRSELLVPISQHTYFGSASVGRVKPEIAGIVESITLEQDLWHGTFLSFEFRGHYARPNYQLWLAFAVQDRWLFYPEIRTAFLF